MHLLLILSMFINVKIDGLDHLRCRGKGLGRGILLPSISSFASHFLSSPEKLLKHSTNQFFFSFLDVMLEKLFPLPSKVVSSYSDLPPTPRRCPRGWRSLGSTPISPSLTSDTFCSQHAHFLISLLVSILTLANRIQLEAGHGHRSLNILSREVDELQPLSIDKRFHQSTK